LSVSKSKNSIIQFVEIYCEIVTANTQKRVVKAATTEGKIPLMVKFLVNKLSAAASYNESKKISG